MKNNNSLDLKTSKRKNETDRSLKEKTKELYHPKTNRQFNIFADKKLNKTVIQNKYMTNKTLNKYIIPNNKLNLQKKIFTINKNNINNNISFNKQIQPVLRLNRDILNKFNIKTHKKEKKLLVLDLDETLIHSFLEPIENPDIILNINIYDEVNDKECSQVYIKKRPGLYNFINELSKYFKIYIFSSSPKEYISNVITKIDKKKIIAGYFSGDNCLTVPGCEHFKIFIKDLKIFNKDLSDIIIVDDNTISYSLQKENGIPIKSWYGESNDIELFKLLPILKKLSFSKDVRTEIKKFIDSKISWSKALNWLNNENKITIKTNQDFKTQILKINNYNQAIINDYSRKQNTDTKLDIYEFKYNPHLLKKKLYKSKEKDEKNKKINPFIRSKKYKSPKRVKNFNTFDNNL